MPSPQGFLYKVSFQETLALLKPEFRRHLYSALSRPEVRERNPRQSLQCAPSDISPSFTPGVESSLFFIYTICKAKSSTLHVLIYRIHFSISALFAMDAAFIALIDYNIADGDSSGIRTHIIGLRGRPPKPFRG